MKEYMMIKGAEAVNNEIMQVKLVPLTTAKRDVSIDTPEVDLEGVIKNLAHNLQRPVTIAYIPISEWKNKEYHVFGNVIITIEKGDG